MIDLLYITYNRLEYLQKSLPSVLKQKDINLIIWDNGSDPKTKNWLKQQGLEVYYNWDNQSLADVTNRVFKKCTSEFVGKVDSDMIIPPDWAERLIAKHREKHYGFLGGVHFRPEDFKEYEPILENGVWHKKHIGGQFVIRREDFNSYQGQGVMGLSEYQEQFPFQNGYIWDLWVEHMEDERSPHYIDNSEYEDYKIKTRGYGLKKYQTGIINKGYLYENCILRKA